MSIRHPAQHTTGSTSTEGENTYYNLLDSVTNNGRVFVEDLSVADVDITSLTFAEVNARNAYAEMVRRLYKDYDDMEHPIATTKEEVLQQRVVAPCLVLEDASSRSAATPSRAGRTYPKCIHVWTDFRRNVESYQIIEDDSSPMAEPMERVFYLSLHRATTKCRTEAEEQFHHIQSLDQTLYRAGIIHYVGTHLHGAVGNIDFVVAYAAGKISIICECKSTHDLLLPMTADECKAAYDTAYDQANTFPKAYSNVAHPIGQLLQYMVDNEQCHGALTSGTRTYFLKIQFPGLPLNSPPLNEVDANVAWCAKRMKMGETTVFRHNNRDSQSKPSDEIKAYISDAWFVGEKNYLRAWAYVHNLHESMPT